MNRNFLLAAAIGWLLIVTVLFCLPGNALPAAGWMDVLKLDKWIHAGIFLSLFVVWTLALGKGAGWQLALVLFAYGWGIEVVQDQLVANRSYDVWDVVADSVGIVLGLVWRGYIKK